LQSRQPIIGHCGILLRQSNCHIGRRVVHLRRDFLRQRRSER
jgi:hypothetical protein